MLCYDKRVLFGFIIHISSTLIIVLTKIKAVHFFSSDTKKAPQLKVLNTLSLKEGDSAILTIASDKLILGTFLMYLLPLISLILIASIAKNYGGEVFSTIAGLTGLFVSLFVVKRILNKQKVSKQFEPQFLRKVINIETE